MKKITDYRKQKILNQVQDDRKGLKRLQKTTFSGSSLTDFRTDVSKQDLRITNIPCLGKNVKLRGVDPRGVEPLQPDFVNPAPHRRGPTPSRILPQAQVQAQAGFIGQAILVLLLAIGIFLGTFLLGQKTNNLAQAAGATVACDGQTLSGQSFQSRMDFTAVYCGTANADTFCDSAKEHWVTEHEAELKKKNIPCKPGAQTGTGQTGTTAGTTGDQTACKSDFTPAYFDAKVANRYARFLAIMKGLPEYCVPADLGVDPALREDSKDGAVKNGRLYLCSRKDNKEGSLSVVWRIVSETAGDPPRESNRNDPGSDKKNIQEVMASHVTTAENKLSITDHFAW